MLLNELTQKNVETKTPYYPWTHFSQSDYSIADLLVLILKQNLQNTSKDKPGGLNL